MDHGNEGGAGTTCEIHTADRACDDAGGAWLLVDAANLRSDANTAPSQQETNALHDKADSRALSGTILAIGGGALVVTGIIKLAIHDPDPRPAPHANGWSVGVSRNGAFVFGRF